MLTSAATSVQVQNLVVSHEQFVTSTRSFPASLGPHGARAWKSLNESTVATRFAAYVQTGIAVGLGHLAPPFATSSAEIGEIARVEVAWASSLTNVVLASSDVIARFGGDEFVVGWLGNADSHVPEELAIRISAHVSHSEVGPSAEAVVLACSIGVAISRPSDRTIDTLLERADRALYDAKAGGKGRIRWSGRMATADSLA